MIRKDIYTFDPAFYLLNAYRPLYSETEYKNPRKHLVYTDFLMIFLSIFIVPYFTSSKSASWMFSSFGACCC